MNAIILDHPLAELQPLLPEDGLLMDQFGEAALRALDRLRRAQGNLDAPSDGDRHEQYEIMDNELRYAADQYAEASMAGLVAAALMKVSQEGLDFGEQHGAAWSSFLLHMNELTRQPGRILPDEIPLAVTARQNAEAQIIAVARALAEGREEL